MQIIKNHNRRIPHDSKNYRHRRGKVQWLRCMCSCLSRGCYRHGERQGKTAAGRLLRRAWRLPAGMSCQCHLIHPSGGRCLRRKGSAGEQACSPAGSTSPPRRRMSRHTHAANAPEKSHRGCTADFRASQLAQWPCQIRLVPEHAPYFQGTSLLIAADCTAYAYAAMHQTFLRGKLR